ncbi:GNAT family N-acetyltransferase [Paenibacillus lutrae]|uniref:GNAT family N-acetyltransferase n=1 Tax=Paenibacillus lutrae TaxID=2078573 RepID=A0A7X3FK66_9BACL|nr:GNAT family N-acetyltransferase [Paenibacillus lutrae]MVP01196.1 GNAT family N-acetyltransferase [Paenibacillus lutrae]
MIRIRPYDRKDLNEMTALMTDLGSPTSVEDMQKRMELIELNPYFYTFVAVLDDKVVGMIGVRLNLTYTSNLLKTQIASLVTKKEYQGQGIGRALLDFIEDWAQQQGSKFIYLISGTSEERHNAHTFYKKRGFDITGYRFVKKF